MVFHAESVKISHSRLVNECHIYPETGDGREKDATTSTDRHKGKQVERRGEK